MVTTDANRRIGARKPVELDIKLQVVPAKKSRLRRDPRPVKATMTNLSVTGAEVESVPLDLEVRDRARIVTEDGVALVEVRRVEPIGRKQVSYGLLFLEIDGALATRLNQLTVGAERGELDWRWSNAR